MVKQVVYKLRVRLREVPCASDDALKSRDKDLLTMLV